MLATSATTRQATVKRQVAETIAVSVPCPFNGRVPVLVIKGARMINLAGCNALDHAQCDVCAHLSQELGCPFVGQRSPIVSSHPHSRN